MIVEMRKCNLVALSHDRDAILNALHKSGAAEIKMQTEEADTFPLAAEGEGVREYLASLEEALALLCSRADAYAREHKCKTALKKDGFEVSYSRFMEAGKKKAFCDGLAAEINALANEAEALKGEIAKAERTTFAAAPYAQLEFPLKELSDTSSVCVRFGVLSAQKREELQNGLCPLAAAQYFPSEDRDVVPTAVYTHKSAAAETDALLSALGFSACPFGGTETGAEVFARLQREREALNGELEKKEAALYALAPHVETLKIYCDYVAFQAEKQECSDKLRATRRTFLLEAYVPRPAEEEVRAALAEATDAFWCEFSDCRDDETPPTLLKNGALVENFESLTNTYSVPNYREFDPNAVMSVFYSIFLGFIIADIAYGVLMLIAGIWIRKTARGGNTGMGRLAAVFACGGVFAIVWGALFNSLFGVKLPIPTLLPDAQSAMWTFAGIRVPSVLVIVLLIGIAHLGVGYFCLLVQHWRRGEYAEGVFRGATWATFSIGAAFAVAGFVEEFAVPALATAGAIVAAVSLLAAVLTAGYRQRFLGKLTKGFSSLYSVINYVSDVLSYARLYGLMLSGAVIAQIISQYAVQFMTGGNILFVFLGAMLMLAGHAFNIAMNLLGAYIHDARLQYVEFYGKFYEGEGELFRPLGSSRTHIGLLTRQPAADVSAKGRAA